MVEKLLTVLLIICGTSFATCNEESKDSEVNTIFVPYQANTVYYPYPFAKARQVRKVMVPVKMDMVPSLYLDEKQKTEQAPLVKFLDGAYPVYYTPGHANGHFNGKIYILE